MTDKQFNPIEEFKSYQPTNRSVAKSYIHTSCNDGVILEKQQRANRNSLYQKPSKVPLTEKGTFTYKIEGKDIVLKKESKSFPELWVRKKNEECSSGFKVAMKNLIIACDVLEIHNDLVLPECNVSIFARKLILKKDVQILTKPLKWDKAADSAIRTGKKKGKDGVKGRNAGEVNIFVESVQGKKLTICSNGGNGQDAGAGLKGIDGNSETGISSDSFEKTVGIREKCRNYCNVYFSPPATLIKYEWYHFTKSKPKWETKGTTKRPSSGTDAIAPGKPGEPGNGGNVTISEVLNAQCKCESKGGAAGKSAKNVKGGKAGTPTKSAQYQLQMEWVNAWESERRAEYSLYVLKGTKIVETKKGKDKKAPTANKKEGDDGKFLSLKKGDNSWLHPAQLKIILKYVRAEYLRNQGEETVNKLKEILQVYLKALDKPFPKIDIWDEKTFQVWSKSQESIAALLSKMGGQNDYYNNPAGYMPLLTLDSSISLYENNLDDSIRSLILAKWLRAANEKATGRQEIIKNVYANVQKEARKLSKKSSEVRKKIKSVEKKQVKIEKTLNDLDSKLRIIETRLLNDATQDAYSQAKIKFGLKMGAGLLQVIPFAQPALGVVGKITSSIADNYKKEFTDVAAGVVSVLDKNDLGEVLKKTKEGLSKARENSENQTKTAEVISNKDNSKSEDIIMELRKKKIRYDGERYEELQQSVKIEKRRKIAGKDSTTEKKEVEEKEKKISKWSQVSGNMTSALSDVVDAFDALSVPESEISAAVDRLKTEDKEWNEVLEKIKKFNKRKARFFSEFIEAFQEYGVIASDIQQNTTLAFRLINNMGGDDVKVDDDLLNFANEIEDQTKDRLIYQLYLLSKAYETTTFKPLEIDWQAENIFDKLSEIIKDKKLEELNLTVRMMKPAFEKNIAHIKDLILTFLTERTIKTSPRIISITDDRHIRELNEKGSTHIDPLELGLISPNYQFQKLVDFKKLTVKFKDKGAVPSINGSYLSVELNQEGIVRVDEDLRVLRSVPRKYTWNGVQNKWKKDKVSRTFNNLLKTILKEEKSNQIAMAPAWSEFKIDVDRGEGIQNHEIEKIELTCSIEAVDANSDCQVIDVRTRNAQGAFIQIDYLEDDKISFLGKFYRVTERKGTIEITAEPKSSGSSFNRWQVRSGSGLKEFTNCKLELDLDNCGKLYTITAIYENTDSLEDLTVNEASEPRFAPQVLYPYPDENEEPFYFVEDNNDVLEYIEEPEGFPNGWAKIVTHDATGFIKIK